MKSFYKFTLFSKSKFHYNLNRSSLLLFFLLVNLFTNAQSFLNYSSVRNTGVSYSSISSTGSSFPGWRYSGALAQDDNRSNAINIGFDFWYMGIRYTQLSVSTNGYLDFSSSTDDGDPSHDDFGPDNSSFTSPSSIQATREALAILYDDLCVSGGIGGLNSSIKYQLSGTAPNRVFTAEWIGLITLNDSTPNLNFQIKLFETSGVIQFNYGTMNTGGVTFSYTCGLNTTTMTGSPSDAQLKSQQTENSNSFLNNQQNNLSALPSSNSQIIFTPIVPADPVTPVTFSSTGCSSMTIDWIDWATNEFGYAIYNSTDNINFTFVTQTAANITSYSSNGLTPGITYYWKVFAVTEGAVSTASIGSNTTTTGLTRYSNNVNGSWSNAAHWSPNGVPSLCDDVIIKNGHTMTINTNASCNNLTVGQGTTGVLNIGNNNTGRSLIVGANITVAAGGTFIVKGSSNATHKMSVKGKIANNSILNFQTDANSLCDIIFTSSVSTSITGNGGITNFNKIILSIGSGNNDSLYVSAANFNAATNDFLTINTGKFHLNNTLSNTFNFTTDFDIHNLAGIVINNSNATFNFNTNLSVEGELKLINGIINVGAASDNNLFLNGGIFEFQNGTLNTAGRFYTPSIAHNSSFIINGGALTVASSGSTNTTISPFHIGGNGASFTMNGGSIIIQQEGGTGAENLGFNVTGTSASTVTGGTLQIGNASSPAGQIININSTVPVGNLLVNSGNVIATLATNNLDVINDITIPSGSLNSNNLDISLGGNWSNGGTWLPTTGTVTFGGTSDHTMENTLTTNENFNHLTTAGSGTLTINDTITLTGDLTIGSGSGLDVSTSNQTINLNGNWMNDGIFLPQSGLVHFNGTLAQQNMSGISFSSFYDLTINNSNGVSILNGNYEIANTLSLPAGVFDVNAANSITLLSDATGTARIAPVTGGNISGNFIVERFIDARAAGYSDLASPVDATTFSDWGNELLLIYTYNPPSAYPSCWGYDETLWDYVPITSTATAVNPGAGYEIWLDSDGNYTTFNNTTLNTIGKPFIGSLNISSNITNVNDGWNLVGNPYASFISWDNLFASSANISNTIMIFDEGIDDYQTYSTGSGIEIAPHQGFWIQSLGSPNFSFSETNKSNSNSSVFRRVEEYFTLKVENIQGNLGLNSHTQFQFSPNGSNDLNEHDISFIGLAHPLAQDLFSVMDGKKLRFNHLSSETEEFKIPVYFDAKENSTYKISGLNTHELYANGFTCALLWDKKSGTSFDLFSNNEYVFNAIETENLNRFELVLSKNNNCNFVMEESDLIQFNTSNNGVNVFLNAQSENQALVKVFNSIGQEIQITGSISPGGMVMVQYPDVTGIYHIQVTVGSKIFSKKFFAN